MKPTISITVYQEDVERFEELADGRTSPEAFTRLLDGKLTRTAINPAIACIIAEVVGLIEEGDKSAPLKMQVFLESYLYKNYGKPVKPGKE